MPLGNSNPILIRKYGDSITECHLSVMSQQTTTATNRARVMHAVIHALYMSGLISRSVYIAIADSGPRGQRYIGALLYTSRSSLGSAIYQCLQQIQKEDYLSAFRDWVKRLQKCVSVKGGIL